MPDSMRLARELFNEASSIKALEALALMRCGVVES